MEGRERGEGSERLSRFASGGSGGGGGEGRGICGGRVLLFVVVCVSRCVVFRLFFVLFLFVFLSRTNGTKSSPLMQCRA